MALPSGQELAWTREIAGIGSVAFSPNRAVLAIGGHGCAIRAADALREIVRFGDGDDLAAFGPDGRYIATARFHSSFDRDGVRLWEVSSSDLRAREQLARGRSTRSWPLARGLRKSLQHSGDSRNGRQAAATRRRTGSWNARRPEACPGSRGRRRVFRPARSRPRCPPRGREAVLGRS